MKYLMTMRTKRTCGSRQKGKAEEGKTYRSSHRQGLKMKCPEQKPACRQIKRKWELQRGEQIMKSMPSQSKTWVQREQAINIVYPLKYHQEESTQHSSSKYKPGIYTVGYTSHNKANVCKELFIEKQETQNLIPDPLQLTKVLQKVPQPQIHHL